MSAPIAESTISATTADGEMKLALRTLPGAGRPLAVVYHDGPGFRPAVEEVARRMAAAGFLAAVPDLYHRLGEFPRFGGPPGSDGHRAMLAAIRSVAEGDLAGDTAAALEALTESGWDGGDAVCLGFCVGATGVLRAMAMPDSRFVAGAMFHPSWCVTDAPDSPHRFVREIAGNLYVAIGEADHVSPPAGNQPLVEELELLGPRATVAIHPGAEHGFMMSDGHYDENAAWLSWAATDELFRRMTGLPPRATERRH